MHTFVQPQEKYLCTAKVLAILTKKTLLLMYKTNYDPLTQHRSPFGSKKAGTQTSFVVTLPKKYLADTF